MTLEHRPAEVILDHISGCLVGIAVGDALGSPARGLDIQDISRIYGRLTEMEGGGQLDLAVGETTSHTAETLILAKSISAQGRIDPVDFSSRLAEWYRLGPKGIDNQTALVLERIATGEDWEHASLKVQAADPESAGIGSLTHCAPVALFHHYPSSVLIEESRLVSRVTHPHSECQWSCAFINLLITELAAGNDAKYAVDNALAFCGHRGDVAYKVLSRVKDAALSNELKELTPSSYVIDILGCSIWALLHHDSFEDSLVAAVNLGVNSGAVGAVTGALAGAAYGIDAIPERWLAYIDIRDRLIDLSKAIISIS